MKYGSFSSNSIAKILPAVKLHGCITSLGNSSSEYTFMKAIVEIAGHSAVDRSTLQILRAM
jgi:hypothetical protein